MGDHHYLTFVCGVSRWLGGLLLPDFYDFYVGVVDITRQLRSPTVSKTTPKSVTTQVSKLKIQITVLLCALLLSTAAYAKVMAGVVTHVSDGDTLWVRLPQGGEPVKVRFQGLDAPESCQEWGPQAAQALKAKAMNQTVMLSTRARDDYGRLIAHVRMDGDDLGAWMVEQGHAWSYHYRNDPGPYAAQERSARVAKRGLWAAANAVDPREFRKQHGSCYVRPAGK
jgi:micrococcal nuclease